MFANGLQAATPRANGREVVLILSPPPLGVLSLPHLGTSTTVPTS
jgi:hypothetical protein